MQALVEVVGLWVVALAAAAFSHFGVELKQAPARAAAPVVERVRVVEAVQVQPAEQSDPCPIKRAAERA